VLRRQFVNGQDRSLRRVVKVRVTFVFAPKSAGPSSRSLPSDIAERTTHAGSDAVRKNQELIGIRNAPTDREAQIPLEQRE
jgi:hypothetical protein